MKENDLVDYEKNDFRFHNSEILRKLYKEKPYQGQRPDLAKVLFVGQDANYPEMSKELLDIVLKYHEDGVVFWEEYWDKYKAHHPFLLPEFSGEVGGIRYHKQFRKLNLDGRYAKFISFVELLDEATYGNTGKVKLGEFSNKVCRAHIATLEKWFINTGGKFIFIPKMVMSTYLKAVNRRTRMFEWLIKCNEKVKSDKDEPVLLYKRDDILIYKCSHFSGPISEKHIENMSKIIKQHLVNFI